MNGTSGFREVRTTTSRSHSNRLLYQQQPHFGTGFLNLLQADKFITCSTGISAACENVPVVAKALAQHLHPALTRSQAVARNGTSGLYE